MKISKVREQEIEDAGIWDEEYERSRLSLAPNERKMQLWLVTKNGNPKKLIYEGWSFEQIRQAAERYMIADPDDKMGLGFTDNNRKWFGSPILEHCLIY